MTSEGFILAYHGCDSSVGERVLAGKDHVKISTNTYDWLGHGAYFWENSPARAFQWAQFLYEHPHAAASKIRDPFVIGAIIKPGACLDLTDAHSLDLISKAFVSLKTVTDQSKVVLPYNEPGYANDEDLIKRFLDCAVIEFLHSLREDQQEPPFNTVRGAFLEGGELYPGARIFKKTHIQWCVRNPSKSIIGYFRIPNEQMEDLEDIYAVMQHTLHPGKKTYSSEEVKRALDL